jgi:hypothetical protein
MKIKELFAKPIGRPINGVIKADQRDEESVWQELDEYVATKQVTDYLRRFFDAYLAAVDNPNDPAVVARMGVWVSGFFGSGKSHFIKILSYLLSNMKATSGDQSRHAVEFFESKLDDAMLLGDVRRAVVGKTDVILFNIDSKADSKGDRDAILQVFLRVFNEMRGLSGDAPHVAEMESYLIGKGVYDKFKEAFKASNGNAWEDERDAVDFLRDDVIAGLSAALGMSPDSAGRWFDNARDDYKINIEGFADLVREYLDRKGTGHRVVFLVDEVGQFIGKNSQLMLNLQTITEELGTLCKGRAWVIVTSQEDIDATLGNDFSKITGRFHTRLSLSSSNTDEVIAHRLLEKTEPARAELAKIWKEKGDIINNQLSFADHAIAFRRFRGADDFAEHYPFAPYQFQLLQKVFESIRKVGATGRHLAKGERSMLDAFQTAAVNNGDKDTDALVPLYDFYPSIESFLDSSVKRAIDQAGDNPALEKWDLKLLRGLFLIRYADAVKGTVDNLATLCLDRIDADKLAFKRQIQESLNRLERQNLVSRNGDVWFFLTNEERDVSQEIKSVDVSASEISKLVAEIVFDEIFAGQSKYRHKALKCDYDFNRILDGSPYKQATNELTLEILSPIGPEYELMTEPRCIGRSAESAGRAILRMENGSRVDLELRTYRQIENYIANPKNDNPSVSIKRILLDRKDENRLRRERIRDQIEALMLAGDFYVLGQKLSIKAGAPLVMLDEMLGYLVANTYSKLGYIKVRQADPIAEIKAVLMADTISQQKISLGGEDGNSLAINEMRHYLAVAASESRVLLSDVVDRFAGVPWGWLPEWETVLLVARLFMAGEVKLVMEGSDLDPIAAVDPLTKMARFKQVAILKRKTSDASARSKARDLHRDMFAIAPVDDEDSIVSSFRLKLGDQQSKLVIAKVKAEQRDFPGADVIKLALPALDRQLSIRDPFEFIGALLEVRSDWLNLADDIHDVLSFYETQVSVWTRMLESMRAFSDNKEALIKEPAAFAALTELEMIRGHATPYGMVNRIESLVAIVERVNERLAAEKREKALLSIEAKINEAIASLDAASADSSLRNIALKPLQDLKAQLAGLMSIPHILFLQGRGGEVLDEAMEKIADAARSKTAASKSAAIAPATVDAKSTVEAREPLANYAAPPKPIKVVRPSELGLKTYLETSGDVEEYINALKAELLSAISTGHRVRVQ